MKRAPGPGGRVGPWHFLALGFLLAGLCAGCLATGSVHAHGFRVAIVAPFSGPEARRGRDMRDGFILATAERDAHPEQHSDGHLGGLDVYVTLIDANGDALAALRALVDRGDVDIVVALATEPSRFAALLDGTRALLPSPGQSPFPDARQPAVRAFVAAFQRARGRAPTVDAARGYHEARRIDAAVRAQNGVGDIAALRKSFSASERDFAW